MPLPGPRHGSASSSGAESWRSDKTIRPGADIIRGNPAKLRPAERQWSLEDSEVSPSSLAKPYSPPLGSRSAFVPRESSTRTPTTRNHHRSRSRSKSQLSNKIASSVMPSEILEERISPTHASPQSQYSYFDQLSGSDEQYSPTSMHFHDDRRPSYGGTSGSSTSNRSRRDLSQKKIYGFFGEDPSGSTDVPQAKRSSMHVHASTLLPDETPEGFPTPFYMRQNSSTTHSEQPQAQNVSPKPSRPRTPQATPSNEVTPWVYQNREDIQSFGDAPVREKPHQQENAPTRSLAAEPVKNNMSSSHLHRFHIGRPKGSKPVEGSHSAVGVDKAEALPQNHRDASLGSRPSKDSREPPSSSNSSDAPSRGGSHDRGPPVPPKDNGRAPKRSLFDKLRGNKKDQSASQPAKSTFLHKAPRDVSTTNGLDKTLSHTATLDDRASRGSGSTGAGQSSTKKEHNHRIPFKTKRRTSHDAPVARDPNDVDPESSSHGALWRLDTDMSQMEGIVNELQQPMLTRSETNVVHADQDDNQRDKHNPSTIEGVWDAPDSWAVKRAGEENEEKLQELDEVSTHTAQEDPGTQYFMRIYKPDNTFSTLSVSVKTTAAELVKIIGKKTYPAEDLNKFSLIMRKHETSRQLKSGEYPPAIQKKLLLQAGYDEHRDSLPGLGKEDQTYLCRFNFLPTKMIGYASLEKDPGFNKWQKFSNMDLQGRNLMTIPIALYQKAGEIVYLNLSRNLSLDVPKDFIQGCVSLREIRYTGNEASRLPPSFHLASKLAVLDVSNNRLEQLEHAELDQLENLASLKLSNNNIKSIPDSFGYFKYLRALNLSSNGLKSLPSSVCELKSLTDLDISFNAISALPHVGGLQNLERLWATNNNLTGRPPDNIANLKNLREIDIRFNKIDSIDVLSQLPILEQLTAGHNSITAFEGSFEHIRYLYLDHNPVTRFDLLQPMATLSTLSLASAKLVQLPDDMFQKIPNLTKLILTKNHFAAISANIGKLTRLEYLSLARNCLTALPADIGRLAELRYLDVRENNITQLPYEIWMCRKLEMLNMSSNCLESFPKPPTQNQLLELEASMLNESTTETLIDGGSNSPNPEETDKLGEIGPVTTRRPSQASVYPNSTGSSPGASYRKGSLASLYGQSPRKPSTLSRTNTSQNTDTISPLTRKESIAQNRNALTFAGSLRRLSLADNRLGDEVFDQITLLGELRCVNLSYNALYEIPSRSIRRWQNLSELYLSGNDLAQLPAEDFEECTHLKILHINSNKFQVLPAELGKVSKLSILDASSNSLKYNVSNWPYDWNWNWNRNLKYLNLSGNKRLEIKQSSSYSSGRTAQDLTDFTSLTNMRVLGLMDVTLMIPSIPDQTEDRRVRTSGSNVGSMAYGISDCLGSNEHLSTIDFVVPRVEGHEDETLIGLFDGIPFANGGSKVCKYLQENFEGVFRNEQRNKNPQDDTMDALRRTYLTLNRDFGLWTTQSFESKERRNAQTAQRGSVVSQLGEDDARSGCVATVMYLQGYDLYVSNVGNAEALLIHSEGGHRILTKKHDPADPGERDRIREAGGYVSRQGKLNDTLDVSRAFGFTDMVPAINANPSINKYHLQETDEMVLLASKELWDFMSPDFAVDHARSEPGDLMRAAQKLRDLAIAFGASNKVTVMLIGISDLRRRERAKFRTHSTSMGPSGQPDEYMAAVRPKRRNRDATFDSKLARLDQEVEAPTGDVSLVFTDIKNSTLLWETYPIAMRSAIRLHNDTMRRHLRLIGGYEVKTEGDAFMVAFPTVTSALLWAFTIQTQLLEVEWPEEILSSVNGQEVLDNEGNRLFRGLSVRMGIHWGVPVCETDPVTRRMDYFGPMVNRAARISTVADGGQIAVSSDFIMEVQRLFETYIESDRSNSAGSEDSLNEEATSMAIRRELRSLHTHGFEVKDLGERRLKGLENPEYIYLMYPHYLGGRLVIQQQRAEAEQASKDSEGKKSRDSQLTIDLDNVWDLWAVSLRLEMLCSALESPGSAELKPPETALLERTRERGGEVTDRFLVNFVEHQISRIETCITSLALRNMIHPFKDGMLGRACPMTEVFGEVQQQLEELKTLKETMGDIDMAPS